MELIAKIIFYAGIWYLCGIAAMTYVRHDLNRGIDPTSSRYDRISFAEVHVLGLLGLITLLVVVYVRVSWWCAERNATKKWDERDKK